MEEKENERGEVRPRSALRIASARECSVRGKARKCVQYVPHWGCGLIRDGSWLSGGFLFFFFQDVNIFEK